MLSHVSTSDDDIISTAESAAIAAIMAYEDVAGTSLYYLPEYWITCRIASDLASRGLNVECEKRFAELLPNQRVKGRIDLAVYATTNENQSRSLRALIEVKGPRTTWPSFPVAWTRLRMAAKSLNAPGLLIGLVYGTETKTNSEMDAEEQVMKHCFPPKILGRERAEFLRTSQRQHLRDRHEGITPDGSDVWEIMSIFDSV